MKINSILILGSAPNALRARDWNLNCFTSIVTINNAWQISPVWTHNIFPSDFPKIKRPNPNPRQHLISAEEYVKVQNLYGGFVYAGGTMAITAAYWTLASLKPNNLFFLGCDMVYNTGKTHFYGKGTPDPLRKDISLRSLEAKTARFECFANRAGCSVFNLSNQKESRLIYRREKFSRINIRQNYEPRAINTNKFNNALDLERRLNYFIPSGKYWKHEHKFDETQIDCLDRIWLSCLLN